jgi:hypothetical protein
LKIPKKDQMLEYLRRKDRWVLVGEISIETGFYALDKVEEWLDILVEEGLLIRQMRGPSKVYRLK